MNRLELEFKIQDRRTRNKPPSTEVSKAYFVNESLFKGWCQENWISTYKRPKVEPYFCTKIYSEWIKDLHVRPETLKLLEESTSRFRLRPRLCGKASSSMKSSQELVNGTVCPRQKISLQSEQPAGLEGSLAHYASGRALRSRSFRGSSG